MASSPDQISRNSLGRLSFVWGSQPWWRKRGAHIAGELLLGLMTALTGDNCAVDAFQGTNRDIPGPHAVTAKVRAVDSNCPEALFYDAGNGLVAESVFAAPKDWSDRRPLGAAQRLEGRYGQIRS
jgi:hypothetical protein